MVETERGAGPIPSTSSRLLGHVGHYLALPVWIFGLVAGALWPTFTLLLLFFFPKLGTVSLALLVIALFTPLDVPCPKFMTRYLRYCTTAASEYYPVTIRYVKREAFKDTKKPFVIGYEPHSVMPQAMSMFGSQPHPDVLPELQHARLLASSAGFWAPLTRHLWWWLGARPVSRDSFAAQLRSGSSVALCPGGVQECLYMERGAEVVYLRRRRGFVRLALQHGTPLVPVFAFGQTGTYSYVRPFIDWRTSLIPKSKYFSFVRRIGYVPMLIFGSLGTAMPKKFPINIVIGEPIVVPRVDSPPPEQVEEYLQKFIAAMQGIFEGYKAECGYPTLKLIVY
ncbi:DGTT4 [Auxenochlorella protothecoides x Auxenochlorella symbiontica]